MPPTTTTHFFTSHRPLRLVALVRTLRLRAGSLEDLSSVILTASREANGGFSQTALIGALPRADRLSRTFRP
jgi:hypothetical protein